MTNTHLYIELPINLNPSLTDNLKIDAISKAIEDNQGKFSPYLDCFIDGNDIRTNIISGSLEVDSVDLFNNAVDISFESEFYAGCKDMNSTDKHEATLDFDIANNKLIFNIELPQVWNSDRDYY